MNRDRRNLLKLVLATSAFGAGLAGAVRFNDGEGIKVGALRASIGVSEAEAKCGSAYNCTGGGGQCGSAYECGGGGGKCGQAYNCSGS